MLPLVMYSIWDNPLVDGDLPCEWQTRNSHDPQAVAIKNVIDGIASDHMVPCKLLGMCQENIFYLFDIHVRLYYRCVKIWMVKIWWIFGQLSILPNFLSTSFPPYGMYDSTLTTHI